MSKENKKEESGKNPKGNKEKACSAQCCGGFGRCFRNMLIVFVALICCVLVISHVKKYKKITQHNDSLNEVNLSSFSIFDDLKIKICGDAFSHDYIRGRSFDDGVAAWLKKSVVPGDTVIEIDQGIGAQALLTAKLAGQSGRVYYFNPYRK